MLKERPIIMQAHNVRAILEGRKTMTRRIVKPQPIWKERVPGSMTSAGWSWKVNGLELNAWPEADKFANELIAKCPYGKVGDLLWVRESWRVAMPSESGIEGVAYRADFVGNPEDAAKVQWRSPLFMPRWASRITLEITDVRVERVQEISPKDCWLEGIRVENRVGGFESVSMFPQVYCGDFRDSWNRINGKGSWKSNPWVWPLSFKLVA